jgi:hypothetical protein
VKKVTIFRLSTFHIGRLESAASSYLRIVTGLSLCVNLAFSLDELRSDRVPFEKEIVVFRLLAIATVTAAVAASLIGCKPAESRGAQSQESAPEIDTPRISIKRSEMSAPVPNATPHPAATLQETGWKSTPAATAKVMLGVDPRMINEVLRKGRISTVDRTSSLSPDVRSILTHTVEVLGGDGVVLFGTPDGFEFLAVAFSNQAALDSFLQAPPQALLWKSILLTPNGRVSSTWEKIENAVVTNGGKRVESKASECHAAIESLRSTRLAIARFEKLNGRSPDFDNNGWVELVAQKLIKASPRNPLSPREVDDEIEVISEVGVKGDAVSARKAGWVWNSSNNALYVAEFSENALVQMAKGAASGSNYIALPDVLLIARLNYLRDIVARLQTPGSRPGKIVYPSAAELSAYLKENGPCPANPINNSAMIQPIDWIKRKPPINGNAGWNYDNKSGKVWANTNLLGEHEF